MKKLFFTLLISFLFISPYITPVTSQDENTPMVVDYIFCNGNIITIDEYNSVSEAIAIKDGIVVDISPTEQILANFYTEDNATTYDLGGRTIMPGFIDGHTHYMRSLVQDVVPPLDKIDGYQERALSYGYTTLNEKSMIDQGIQYLMNAEANNLLRLRVNVFPLYNLAWLNENEEPIIVETWYPDNDPILNHNRMLRIPGIKIFADGAYGVRGWPAMSTPWPEVVIDTYNITSPDGHLYFNQTELNSIVRIIHNKGFSCAFHAMGDRAIETVLTSIKYVLGTSNNDEARHQIEHNSFFREDLIAEALSLNTLHSVRGYFPTYWQEEDESYYRGDWEEWLEWYVNRFSLPDLGIHAFLESDYAWDIHPEGDLSTSRNINPFLHLWGLVTRKAIDPNGTIHDPHPWLAEHEISVESALRMMTIEGAYAVKQEDYIGSLYPGKYADLIVLNGNPLTLYPDDLKDLEVLLTMVGGKIEYQVYTFLRPEDETGIISWNVLLVIPGLFIITLVVQKKSKTRK